MVQVKRNNKVLFENRGLSLDGAKQLYFSGCELDTSPNQVIELSVVCSSAFLHTLEQTKMKDDFWRPINSPRNRATMEPTEVQRFFDGALMPDAIASLLPE